MTTRKHLQYIAFASSVAAAAGCAKDKTNDREGLKPEHAHAEGEACPMEDGLNFTTGGTPWANKNVTYSFMPDGTVTIAGTSSDLFAQLNARHQQADWKRQFAIAFSTWSTVSGLNFREVSDSGANAGTSGQGQGDPRFGDIRVGMRDIGSAGGTTTYPSTVTSGGDMYFNSARGTAYNIGATLDIGSVAVHEGGHALGLGHSTSGTIMFGFLSGVKMDLAQDDIDGIQSLYGARPQDSYDAAAANEDQASASAVTTSAEATLVSGDLTSHEDVDFYKTTVPAGVGPVLSVTLVGGQSLLQPTVSVYDQTGALVGEAAAADYAQGVLVQVEGATAGSEYAVQVHSPGSSPLGVGLYQIAIEYRASADGQPYEPGPQINADSYEPNETFAASKNLGTTSDKTVSGLSIHTAADQDYFHFKTATTARTYNLTLTYGAGTQPVYFEILNSNGSVRASSNGASSLNFSVSKSTTYKIRVWSPSGSPREYNMRLRKVN